LKQTLTTPPADAGQIQNALKRLVRAVGRGSPRDSDIAYRDLYEFGPQAIPLIQEMLSQWDWRQQLNKGSMEVLTTFVSLIHDLDESQSSVIVGKLERDCHPIYRTRLQTILRFQNGNYRRYAVGQVSIYESSALRLDIPRAVLIRRWLSNVPADDLEQIKRIYLIPSEKSLDYRGLYFPNLYKIILVWDNPLGRWNPLAAVFNFLIERTLYHEIGHHVHRHTYGRDPDQEDQADAYANKILRASHPTLRKFARILYWVRRRRRPSAQSENVDK